MYTLKKMENPLDQTIIATSPTGIIADCISNEEDRAEEKQLMLECIEMLAFDDQMQ